MLPRYRQRRGPYALATPSPAGGIVRRFAAFAILALLAYLLVRWALGALGVGNHVERKPVLLDVEERSNVTVSLEGGLLQRADGRVPLWPEDRVVSNANGFATLTFFDGTVMRIDEQSELTVDESDKGTKESAIASTLVRGALWTRTPDTDAFTGAIARSVATEHYTAFLPSDADVVLGSRTVLVFSGDGDGVRIEAEGAEDLVIGEGQQLVVPEDEEFGGDLRRFRSAMDPLTVRRAFIEESRSLPVLTATGSAATPPTDIDLLTVDAPADGQTVSGSTVRVQGAVGARIERVRVNGYPATINRTQGTYSQELAMPATETFTIRVEALDRTGVIVEQQERTVRAAAAAAAGSPSITQPGRNGETVRTASRELEIRGTVPAGTAAVYVNDYKLQLFRAGDTQWSYLASIGLTNLKEGENVFNVVAEDAAGSRSAPATITIVVGEAGPTPPVGGASSSSSVAPPVSESTLPTNDPLRPGTLAVTAPAPGTSATHTGTGFLLEGTTIADTASMWVNGYRLQLYEPGKTFWNYWALPRYDTLKPGTNAYRIVSRDAQNRILDAMTYTVEYRP